MSRSLKAAVFFVFVSILLHGYLTFHYYPLKFGMSSGSMACNINDTLNCDSVAASPYAAFLGIPVAMWGLIANAILLLTLLSYWFGFVEDRAKLHRFNFWLAAGSVAVSFVMGGISLAFMQTYCIFCIALYLLSLAYFWIIKSTQEGPVFASLGDDFRSYFSTDKYLLGFLIAIPLLSWLGHRAALVNYGAGQLDVVVQSSLNEWKLAPEHSFPETPSLKKASNGESKMKIVEFADFRCGHCKQAAPSLDAFVKGHSNVELSFYSFALDSTCNPELKQGDGISCRLAKAVYCSGLQEKGWDFHDEIFRQQSAYSSTASVGSVDNMLKSFAEKTGTNWTTLLECMDKAETHSIIQDQAKAGVRAGVRGTPTIYVNGRKVEGGVLIPVLQALRADILRGN